ncbi:MAG: sigma-70 family RNA polymerase sigma factor [Nitriliruptoraceae bacterium]|nr:sigma-70 family RNA polymerase sigma factor [Nitriliruptoraceae bacterium]
MSGPGGVEVPDARLLSIYADPHRRPAEREEAFRVLVERFQRRVFAVCLRVLGSPPDAEDATQETFVKLARGAGSFRGDAQVSTWIYRIARNVCTDRVRFEARRPSTPVVDEALERADPDADHAALVDASDALRRALAQLDERSRTLLLLVSVDGLSYAEAAEVTDLAIGTVKSRVARARVRLGELLADADESPTDAPPPAERHGTDDPGHPVQPRGPPSGAGADGA